MANKFQKSVQARMEQAGRDYSKVEPNATKKTKPPKNTLEQNMTNKEKKDISTISTDVLPKPGQKNAVALEISPALLDIASPGEGRRAKNKTMYLDEAVIEAIRLHAITRGVTDSALVNDLLRRVFGL